MGVSELGDDLKKQHRDTIFRSLFKKPDNFLHLLRHCRGTSEDMIADDIQPFDLDSTIISRIRRNDVSFITKDNRLIILVEHQSTVNPNMAFRLLSYYMELLQIWIKQNNINIFASKRIPALPVPEFYVAYNGNDVLKEEYSSFQLSCTGIKIDVIVKVIDIRFDCLEDTETTNILAGYSYFYRVFDLCRFQGMTNQEAFETARKECMANGYLPSVIEKEDFVMFYKDFLDYDAQLRAEGRDEGEAKGAEAAIRIAIQTGAPSSLVNAMAKGLNISSERVDELMKEVLGVGVVS